MRTNNTDRSTWRAGQSRVAAAVLGGLVSGLFAQPADTPGDAVSSQASPVAVPGEPAETFGGTLSSPRAPREGEPSPLFRGIQSMGDIEFDVTLGMQYRYTVSAAPHADQPNDEESLGFSFRRLRPIVDFWAAEKRLHAFCQAEANSSETRLLDLWVSYDINDDWRLRVGQFHLGFSREQTVSVFKQLATDLSSIGFNINQEVGLRVQGLDLTYTKPPHRVDIVLSEGLGVAGTSFNDETADWGATVRYEGLLIGDSFAQFAQHTAPRGTPRGLLLGLTAHTHHLHDRGDRVAFAADLSFQENGFNAMVQGTCHISEDFNRVRPGLAAPEPESAYGIVSHAGLYIADDLEPFVRGEWATTSDPNHPDLKLLTAGVNWYIAGQVLRVTGDATVALDGIGPAFDLPVNGQLQTPDGDTRFIFRLQLQAVF